MEYWFIAVTRSFFEYYDEKNAPDSDEMTVEEHYILISAASPLEAYRKVMEREDATSGIEGVDEDGRKGKWRFIGIEDLLPLYEPLEDGCELICNEVLQTREEIYEDIANPLGKEDLTVFKNWSSSIKVTTDNKEIYPENTG